MSDYTQITDFSAKDALTSGDPEKIIYGADIDAEFAAIVTAIATKYDSADLASTAQAQAETLNTVLITPSTLGDWSDANGGLVGELHALTDPGADRILFWDDGEVADSNLAFLTVSNGLEIATTTLGIADSAAGAGLTASSGVLAVGAGSGLTVNANDVAITDQAATSSNPIAISAGTHSIDLTGLTNIIGSDLAPTDHFLVSDAGTNKAIDVRDMGFQVQTAQTTQTLALNDMNTVMEFNGTATLTLPANATTAIPIGSCVIVVVDHATQTVTVTAAGGVTLNSIYHPGGTAAASDTVNSGGMAVVMKVAADEWWISGDIST